MYWQGLPITLALIAAVNALRHRDPLWHTPAILLADWWICTLTAISLNDHYPWLMYAVVDWLALVGLFAIRTSHWQTVLMLSFSLELICHAAYGCFVLWGSPAAIAQAYSASYDVLLFVAWGQAALCGTWTIYDIARHRRGSDSGRSVDQADVASLAESSERKR